MLIAEKTAPTLHDLKRVVDTKSCSTLCGTLWDRMFIVNLCYVRGTQLLLVKPSALYVSESGERIVWRKFAETKREYYVLIDDKNAPTLHESQLLIKLRALVTQRVRYRRSAPRRNVSQGENGPKLVDAKLVSLHSCQMFGSRQSCCWSICFVEDIAVQACMLVSRTAFVF